MDGGGIEAHGVKDGRGVRRHCVRHVSTLAVEDDRDVSGHRSAKGRERVPAAWPVLLPERGVGLVAARGVCSGVDDTAAESYRAVEPAGNVLRFRIEANAKEGIPRCGRSAQLLEVIAVQGGPHFTGQWWTGRLGVFCRGDSALRSARRRSTPPASEIRVMTSSTPSFASRSRTAPLVSPQSPTTIFAPGTSWRRRRARYPASCAAPGCTAEIRTVLHCF